MAGPEARPAAARRRYEGAGAYGFQDFDKHLCLTPGVWTWLVIAFLMRPYVILVLSLANAANRLELVDLVYADRLWLAVDALAALPAVALTVAFGLRRPGARRWVRWVWARGRRWLLASALASAAVALASLLGAAPGRTSIAAPALLCLSLWALWYVFTARRLRDAFGDFPEEEDEAPAR